ncbi:hypothetical protein FZEAL_4043 [Fusarium zealandicum]|uniref:Uncharacterized protein n=1 Tax=Fusarium zealandicum TaxID=1053134 RepID=A0A8H4UNB2_9HYPO|nr:hypothetical protein FZEAL_4043 [Fusarium zealandicum]
MYAPSALRFLTLESSLDKRPSGRGTYGVPFRTTCIIMKRPCELTSAADRQALGLHLALWGRFLTAVWDASPGACRHWIDNQLRFPCCSYRCLQHGVAASGRFADHI